MKYFCENCSFISDNFSDMANHVRIYDHVCNRNNCKLTKRD